MSWAEIKKAVNSDISVPLNEKIEKYFVDGQDVRKESVMGWYPIDPPQDAGVFEGPCLCVLNGMLYAMGASSGSSTTAQQYNIYKLMCKEWVIPTKKTNGLRKSENHAVATDRTIFVFGSDNSGNPWNGYRTINAWDNPVIISTFFPYYFRLQQVVMKDGFIYMLGGYKGTANNNASVNYTMYRMSIYTNPSTAQETLTSFTTIGDTPGYISSFLFKAAVLNNDIYATLQPSGGNVGLYKYHDGSWTLVDNLQNLFPGNGTYDASIVAYNNKLYFVGTGSQRNEVYSFDGENWTKLPNMPINKSNNENVIVYNNKIHYIGKYITSSSMAEHHWVWDGKKWDAYKVPFVANEKYINKDGDIVL